MTPRTRHVREFIETMLGPIVFVLYFGIAYFVSATGCVLAGDPPPALAVSAGGIRVVLGLLTVIALALIALTGVAASRSIAGAAGDPEDKFLAYVTLILAVLSGIAVLWVATPAAVLPLCS